METIGRPGKLLISGLPSGQDTVSKNMMTEFHRFTTEKYRFITSSKCGTHSILITEKGQPLTFGENKYFECGQSNSSKTYEIPTAIPKLEGIKFIQAAAGRHHSLLLSDEGRVFAFGDNSKGQCGIGSVKSPVKSPQLINYDGPKIVKIDCGADFSVILDVDGNLYAFGSPEFGQLGNNTNGQYFITTVKLSFHFERQPLFIRNFVQEERRGKMTQMENVCIKDIACGKFHTIALDTMGRIFTWGFGGNGQLGHNDNQDQYCPRLVKYLTATRNEISKIFGGAKYTVVLTLNGTFMMFGEFGGKNYMYPQQQMELMGCTFSTMGCSKSMLAATTEDLMVVWGRSPTSGELGLGIGPRSSGVPTENVNLKEMKIIQIAMSCSYSMLLVDIKCPLTNKKYSKFARYDPVK